MTYHVGQQDSTKSFRIVAIENGKVALEDKTASQYRNAKSVRWYKIDSAILAAKINR
jgi:hypothetical protein